MRAQPHFSDQTKQQLQVRLAVGFARDTERKFSGQGTDQPVLWDAVRKERALYQ